MADMNKKIKALTEDLAVDAGALGDLLIVLTTAFEELNPVRSVSKNNPLEDFKRVNDELERANTVRHIVPAMLAIYQKIDMQLAELEVLTQ